MQEEEKQDTAPEEDYWTTEGYEERATMLCELVMTFGLPLHMAKRYADEWEKALTPPPA